MVDIQYDEIAGSKGIAIGESEFFLEVDRKGKLWCFRLLDISPQNLSPITGWVKLLHIQDLRRKRIAKPIREWAKRFAKAEALNVDEIIEKIIIAIEGRIYVWQSDKDEPSDHENTEFDESIEDQARALLRDPAFFYKIGGVFHHGFLVPKINKARFIIGEERNKRITGPILIGASLLNMTSLFKFLGEVGTAKDSILRMWLKLLSQGIVHIERSYITAASLRYSEHMKQAHLLYIPDIPKLKGETGRQIRFMRADDGGLISEYATRDSETGEMTTKVAKIPVKAIATTSNEITGDAAIESGMWTLKTCDDEDLTQEVKEEKLKFRAGKRPLFPEEELKVWMCAFKIMLSEELMEELPIVPYAEKLIKIFDSTKSASRRDPDKLCDLISVIGWMRRFQKEKRGETDIVDLYLALQMGFDAITQTISELNDKEKKIVEAVREAAIDEVTCRYVANVTGIPYKTCYHYLDALVWEKGVLLKEKAKGRNIYSSFPGTVAGYFLDGQRRSFEKPETLVKLILESFGGFSLSHTSVNEFILIDPITGDEITVKEEKAGQTVSQKVTVEKKTYSQIYEKVRKYQRSTETVSELEKEALDFLPTPIRNGQSHLEPTKAKSAILQNGLNSVVSTLMQLAKETGLVEKTVLLNELKIKHNIPARTAELLLGLLLREGSIFSPREGYLKKT